MKQTLYIQHRPQMSDSESEFFTQSQKDIFTPLKLSVISLNGFIEGINLDEQTDIKKFKCVGNIVEVGSNFGVISTPQYAEYKQQNKKKKRSSKKKKAKPNRRCGGTGTHIASQITIVIHSPEESTYKKPKYYKVKVFRTGPIQIPGVKELTYHIIANVLNQLINYLRRIYNPEARLVYLVSSMQNFNCKLAYTNLRIKLKVLEMLLENYKSTNPFQQDVVNLLIDMGFPDPKDDPKSDNESEDGDVDVDVDILDLPEVPKFRTKNKVTRLDQTGLRDMLRIMAGRTKEQLAEIIYEPDGPSSSVSVKFYRSPKFLFNIEREKDPKRTILKMMLSGKITAEGGNCIEEVEELRRWIMQFMEKHRNEVFGNITHPYDVSDSDSDEESVYADYDPKFRRTKKTTRPG